MYINGYQCCLLLLVPQVFHKQKKRKKFIKTNPSSLSPQRQITISRTFRRLSQQPAYLPS